MSYTSVLKLQHWNFSMTFLTQVYETRLFSKHNFMKQLIKHDIYESPVFFKTKEYETYFKTPV